MLLAELSPEFGLARITLMGEGWDNRVYRVATLGDVWLFRFPRRAVAVPGVERECAVLPVLGRQLPLPIPVPEWVGIGSRYYPWPYFGYRPIPGVEVSQLDCTDENRGSWAQPLGQFLRTLHNPDLGARFENRLPVDPIRRMDMAYRAPWTLDLIDEMDRTGLISETERLRAIVSEALALGPMTRNIVVHGDLHFRQILLTPEREISGVIDWGDLCLSHPAVDLQVLWSTLPPAARPAFFSAYGRVDDETLIAARLIAVVLSLALLRQAHAMGYPTIVNEAERALGFTLRD